MITGFAAGHRYESRLQISLPLVDGGSSAVGKTWARAKIEDLKSPDAITQVALEHHLMTQFTSFVAVDDHGKTVSNQDPNAPQAVAGYGAIQQPVYSQQLAYGRCMRPVMGSNQCIGKRRAMGRNQRTCSNRVLRRRDGIRSTRLRRTILTKLPGS